MSTQAVAADEEWIDDGKPIDDDADLSPVVAKFVPPQPGEMLRAAEAYARIRIPVFPLHFPELAAEGLQCSCKCSLYDPARDQRRDGKKVDRCTPAKHPLVPRGVHDATTDLRVIRNWWRRWPNANIGAAMGFVADVADLDGADGVESFRKLLAGQDVATVPVSRSGRPDGGWHYWFAATGVKRDLAAVPHVDWMGREGYVVVAPSRHVSGVTYSWDPRRPRLIDFVDPSTGALNLPSAPSNVVTHLRAREATRAAELERRAAFTPHTAVEPPIEARTARMQKYMAGRLRNTAGRLQQAEAGTWHRTMLSEGATLYSFAYGGVMVKRREFMAVLTELDPTPFEGMPNGPGDAVRVTPEMIDELLTRATHARSRDSHGRTPRKTSDEIQFRLSTARDMGAARAGLPDLGRTGTTLR